MNNIKNFIQNEEGIMAIEITWIAAIMILVSTVLLTGIFQQH